MDNRPQVERTKAIQGWIILGCVLLILVLSGVGLSIYHETIKSAPPPLETTEERTGLPASSPVVAGLSMPANAAALPAPKIRLSSPTNTTYTTPTPKLELVVGGSNLDTVLVSIDNGHNVSIPHDGTLALIDFAHLELIFIEDFSSRDRWVTVSGNWKLLENAFFQDDLQEGLSAEAYTTVNASDFIVEYRTKVRAHGKAQSKFYFQSDAGSYALVIHATQRRVELYRTDSWELISSGSVAVYPDKWHDVRIVVNKSIIRAYVNDELVINTEQSFSELNSIAVASWESQVYFDNIQVYKQLSDGPHLLTVYANNTAGNQTSTSVYFTVTQDDDTWQNADGPADSSLEIEVSSVDTYAQVKNHYLTQVEISVKNRGKKERPFKLIPDPVLLDDLSNQYDFVTLNYEKEIKQSTIFPNVTRKGLLFFEPVLPEARELRLILYVNGERYEFHFNLHGPNPGGG
jgi:hypothetical protein